MVSNLNMNGWHALFLNNILHKSVSTLMPALLFCGHLWPVFMFFKKNKLSNLGTPLYLIHNVCVQKLNQAYGLIKYTPIQYLSFFYHYFKNI